MEIAGRGVSTAGARPLVPPMTYQVLARRWRPTTFDAVVGQGPIVRTLQNALARGRIAHAYLFAGPRGCGKTTTARLLAMGLNCEGSRPGGAVPCAACAACREVIEGRALDVIEIDGASNRGIEDVRALRENARYAPARGHRKVYIIDEVHMLTEPAFNALLKTLEEPPAHVVFVLATTEARKLPATILSRCQRFDFRPIATDELTAALQRVVDEEARRAPATVTLAAEPDALRLVARSGDGSLRDALSLLDTALAYSEGQVTVGAVRELLGTGGAETAWALAEALVGRRAAEALGLVGAAAAAGLDLTALTDEVMEALRQALLIRVAGAGAPDLTADEAVRLGRLGAEGASGVAELTLLVKGLLDAQTEMQRSLHPRIDMEVAILRLCHRPEPQPIEAILARLEEAEGRLRGYGVGEGPVPEAGPVQADLLGGPPSGSPTPRPGPAPVRVGERSGPSGRAPGPVAGGGAASGPPVASVAGPAASSADSRPVGSGRTAPGGGEGADTWARIVAEVTRVRPILGQILAGGVVVSEEGGRLTVAIPNGNSYTQDELRRPANRELIVEAARRVRPEIREVDLTTESATSGSADGLADHPRVKIALSLFEGEIAAVRPTGLRDRTRAPEEEP